MVVIERPRIRQSSALSGQSLDAPLKTFAGPNRTTNYKHGVFATERAQDVREPLKVERLRNRLCSAGNSLEDEQLAHTVHRRKELRQHVIQHGPGVVRGGVGRRIPNPTRRWYPRESEFAKIAREGRLRHLKTAVVQQATKLLLTRNGLGLDDLENEAMTLLLLHDVGHLG